MSERARDLEDRTIEYDGLAITMLALGFIFIAALTVWIAGNAAQRFDAPVFATAALVGTAVCAAWCFGYPRYAAIPAMALVILLAAITLPLVFDMNGALLREASGTPPSRIYVAMGLYVGGLGVGFLAFMVFGFLGPLAGAVLRLKRRETGARFSLILHVVITGLACAITLPPLVGA